MITSKRQRTVNSVNKIEYASYEDAKNEIKSISTKANEIVEEINKAIDDIYKKNNNIATNEEQKNDNSKNKNRIEKNVKSQIDVIDNIKKRIDRYEGKRYSPGIALKDIIIAISALGKLTTINIDLKPKEKKERKKKVENNGDHKMSTEDEFISDELCYLLVDSKNIQNNLNSMKEFINNILKLSEDVRDKYFYFKQTHYWINLLSNTEKD